MALHAGVVLAACVHPRSLKIGAPALVANHLLLSVAGAWPRGTWLGPNLVRLPEDSAGDEVVLTFDDGPDPRSTPAVLDLLDRHDARATFFCLGQRVARHPELSREIVARGHTIENHTWSHPHTFAFYLFPGLRREIVRAQEAIHQVTGRAPEYFRPPAGMRNPLLEAVLAENGLALVTWTDRGFDTALRDPDLVARLVTRRLEPGGIVLLHDGGLGQRVPPIEDVLPRILDALSTRGLRSVPLPEGLGPG